MIPEDLPSWWQWTWWVLMSIKYPLVMKTVARTIHAERERLGVRRFISRWNQRIVARGGMPLEYFD